MAMAGRSRAGDVGETFARAALFGCGAAHCVAPRASSRTSPPPPTLDRARSVRPAALRPPAPRPRGNNQTRATAPPRSTLLSTATRLSKGRSACARASTASSCACRSSYRARRLGRCSARRGGRSTAARAAAPRAAAAAAAAVLVVAAAAASTAASSGGLRRRSSTASRSPTARTRCCGGSRSRCARLLCAASCPLCPPSPSTLPLPRTQLQSPPTSS